MMDLPFRFVGIWMVLVIYIAVDVDGVAFGEACTGAGSGNCDETTNVICSTTCVCDANFYRKSNAAACAAVMADLDGACDADDTASGQCTKGSTACTLDGAAGKCQCISTHFSDGTDCQTKITLTNTCDTAHTGPCEDANAECRLDGGTNKCLCKTTHYADSSVCTLKKALSATCTASPNDQCLENGACTDTTCSCNSGFFANNAGACTAKVAALTDACVSAQTASDQCAVADSECRDDAGSDKCLCKATHFTDGAACTIRKAPEDTCSGDVCVTHATCDTTCKCNAGYTASPSTNPTMCSGVVKFASLSYMYVVPILVSLMFLVR